MPVHTDFDYSAGTIIPTAGPTIANYTVSDEQSGDFNKESGQSHKRYPGKEKGWYSNGNHRAWLPEEAFKDMIVSVGYKAGDERRRVDLDYSQYQEFMKLTDQGRRDAFLSSLNQTSSETQ